MVVKPAAAVGLLDPHPNQPLVPRLAQPSPAVKLFIRENYALNGCLPIHTPTNLRAHAMRRKVCCT